MAEPRLPGGPGTLTGPRPPSTPGAGAGVRQLADLFTELGVPRGGVLMAHASLGGSGLRAEQVRDALLAALGPDGTLVVPAFSPENSLTSRAYRELTAGMSAEREAAFRASRPPFDPATTPCPTMGVLAECVRTTPGAVRSIHPHTSFAGLGPRAAELLAGHAPHCHLGEESPLGALYAADAHVLLFRVGFEVCSAFHLAEYRLRPAPPPRSYSCVADEPGRWVSYEDITLYDGDFGAIGARLPRDLAVRREMAGRAVRLFGMREAVDLAGVRMSGYRQGLT